MNVDSPEEEQRLEPDPSKDTREQARRPDENTIREHTLPDQSAEKSADLDDESE